MRSRGSPPSFRNTWYLPSIFSTTRSGMMYASLAAEYCSPGALLRRGAQVAVLRDVADELLREELLARGQVEQPHLLPQVVRQILGLDRDGLDVLPGFAHVARGRAVAAVVQEDVLPVRLIVVLGLLLLLDAVLRLGQLRIVFGLDQLQEGVAEQLLLQVLL